MMMKNKGLLIATAVLAALGGAVYWSEKKKAADEKNPPVVATAAPKILTIPEDQIQGISIAKRGGDTAVLSKASGRWAFTAPSGLGADQDAVNGVVQNLANLSSDRLVEEKPTSLTAFGLAQPASTITVTRRDKKSDTLLLGDDTPTGSGSYAKLAQDPRIFIIASYVKTGLEKTSQELRDKRLLHFNQDKLTSITIAGPGTPFEFGKNAAGEWQIVKPSAMRADAQQVDELVRKLKDAKMDTALSPADTADAQKAFATGTKVATITTADSSGPETLEVRKAKGTDYYAKSSSVDGYFKVAAELGQSLEKSMDEYRNKKLFDFSFADPSQVGVGTQVFQKSGEQWVSGGGQMDASSVQTLVDKLRDLTATGFAAKSGGEPFLALSATANGGKRQERVSVSKQGSDYYATREGEPSVYRLAASSVEDIQKAASSVKPATAAKTAPKK